MAASKVEQKIKIIFKFIFEEFYCSNDPIFDIRFYYTGNHMEYAGIQTRECMRK